MLFASRAAQQRVRQVNEFIKSGNNHPLVGGRFRNRRRTCVCHVPIPDFGRILIRGLGDLIR